MANEKTYQNVEELIHDLIDTGYDEQQYPEGYVNWQNFNASFFKGVEDSKPDFWKELLTYLQSHSPTLESDFDERQGVIPSVFWYINENSDLIHNNVWYKITNEMVNGVGIDLTQPSGVANNPDQSPNYNYFWNESLSKLIAIYLTSFDTNAGEIELKNGVSIPLSDLKNADAGYSFIQDWVTPTFNIDEESYEEVRGADAIKSVLKNSNELQYTRKKTENGEGWLRLLMPKYMRKVEVEDLNRNFWVIGQTLSAICAYLFGSKSVKDLFEGILKELVGLWENCLYLWAAAAMISQEKKVEDIHIEFAPLTNSKIYGYRKFDNFGETYTNVVDEIKERMDYLIQLYSDSHIIIIPEIRGNNYKHNYYSKVEYPGMMVYNRNTSNLTWVNFKVDQAYQMGGEHLIINLAEDFNSQGTKLYVDKIGAIIDDEIHYDFQQDFSSISPSETSPYYAAIRTRIPNFNVAYNSSNDTFVISNFKICFYDAAAQAIDGNEYLICSFDQSSTLTISNETSINLPLVYNNSGATSGTLPSATDVPIAHGYYLGELVSCQSIIGLNSYSIESHSYHGQQLYSADPEQIIDIMEGS